MERIWERCALSFAQQRNAERARWLMFSHLACLGRHTITGLLCAGGRQFTDWSADYRLFERARIDEDALFSVVQGEVEERLAANQPLVVAMDDSILRKKGRKVHGTGWRRDPLSPPFHVNFAWGQRILQISAALPYAPGQARMIPIDFRHIPPAAKPRTNASALEQRRYREENRQSQINVRALERLHSVRRRTDPDRTLLCVVDGRFTNRTVLKALPDNTVLIGRIRKDAKLHEVPDPVACGLGRRRVYGPLLPTPEQLRQDESVPWQKIDAVACGKTHSFRVKTLDAVRWRGAGPLTLRLLVIAPLAYRKTLNGKLLYRKPAYIICSDPTLSVAQVLQTYLWRWDIEVNFRDEKTLLGTGQAQVRTPLATQKVPAFQVVAYSVLLLAADKVYGSGKCPMQLPAPKWRSKAAPGRVSTNNLVNQLRYELWNTAIDPPSFNHFCIETPKKVKCEKYINTMQSAVFYATP